MHRFDEKVVVTTGAARGQGRSHAVRFAGEGADITAVDICEQIDTIAYPMATEEDLAETVRLVEERGRRIYARKADVRGLDKLIDVVKRYVTGRTDTKSRYLEGLKERPRTTTRGDDLDVRLFGDVALMSGTLHNEFPSRVLGLESNRVQIQALQVWVKRNRASQLVAFAASGSHLGA
jgi:NAD(P)-dependent dehydrogenase (short-subunit alcohol dehydrogenase family)